MQPVNLYEVVISNILARWVHQLFGLDCILRVHRAYCMLNLCSACTGCWFMSHHAIGDFLSLQAIGVYSALP